MKAAPSALSSSTVCGASTDRPEHSIEFGGNNSVGLPQKPPHSLAFRALLDDHRPADRSLDEHILKLHALDHRPTLQLAPLNVEALTFVDLSLRRNPGVSVGRNRSFSPCSVAFLRLALSAC
jgi:hypothetical protein